MRIKLEDYLPGQWLTGEQVHHCLDVLRTVIGHRFVAFISARSGQHCAEMTITLRGAGYVVTEDITPPAPRMCVVFECIMATCDCIGFLYIYNVLYEVRVRNGERPIEC